MPSKAKRDFEVFNGGLKGKYVEDVVYSSDRLARKFPADFDLIEADAPADEEDEDEGGEIE